MLMGDFRLRAARVAVAVVAVVCTSCGTAAPQLIDAAATAVGTPSPVATHTVAVTAGPTASPIPTVTPGPSPTPNMAATSASVFATITALAASPTYPPTSTPRPERTPISAGPDLPDIPPTALYTSGGIGVLSIPAQVFAGSAAALTVMTKPAAVCLLKVDHSSTEVAHVDPAPGTTAQVAGRAGVVAWVWNVDAGEPAGMMRLIVDCGVAGMARLQLKVVK